MHKVELEFKRIQTYLFSSPRLKAMLGANAALGQTIRTRLPEIAKECGAQADPYVLEKMPQGNPDDPLPEQTNGLLVDDPQRLYREYGVLVRDGGHFIATFPSPEQGRSFIEQANHCITEALPGILIEARLDGDKPTQAGQPNASLQAGESLFQHPAFQVSQHLGNRPAKERSRGAKAAFVSAEEAQMEERGSKFRDNPRDLIALLENSRAIPCPVESPESLDQVTQGDYLALVHADGNGIGKRYQAWRKKSNCQDKTDLELEAHGEHFFHSMRVAVRRGLTTALNEVFKGAPENYQLLMLGGDDLLLVCSARHALRFVCAYAKALNGLPLSDGEPLSIGAGVVIAKGTFPFHRLHATAEALADSAKQRYRADTQLGSVVDWHVTSSSWLEDPLAERRADSLAGHAVLSNKPYPVLGPLSLSTLLEQADKLGLANSKLAQANTVARSQLRNLVEVMRQGSNLAELAMLELPEKMRDALRGFLKSLGYGDQLFKAAGDSGWKISVLPDLVELFEIDRRPDHNNQEDAA